MAAFNPQTATATLIDMPSSNSSNSLLNKTLPPPSLPLLAVCSAGSGSVCILDASSGYVVCEWGPMLADPYIVRPFDVAFINIPPNKLTTGGSSSSSSSSYSYSGMSLLLISDPGCGCVHAYDLASDTRAFAIGDRGGW
jgi:hypothetical protein